MTHERRRDINRLADIVRTACNLQTPVDVDTAVTKLGGKVSNLTGGTHEAKIEKDGAGFVITLDPDKVDVRRRFSVAHELGHLFLHMGYLIDKDRWEQVKEYEEYARFGQSTEEYEAHEFAAAFLMPEGRFRDVAHTYKSNGQYHVGSIADHFNVSVEAATNRGRWLGMFSWD